MKLCRCGAIVKGKCGRCSPAAKHVKGTSGERGYDYAWQKLQERKLKADPLCECGTCDPEVRVVEADQVHHIVPISEAPWLRLVWSNLMSVTDQCHRRIHAEMRREEARERRTQVGVGANRSIACSRPSVKRSDSETSE